MRCKKRVLTKIQEHIFRYAVDVDYLFDALGTYKRILPPRIEQKFTLLKQASIDVQNSLNEELLIGDAFTPRNLLQLNREKYI